MGHRHSPRRTTPGIILIAVAVLVAGCAARRGAHEDVYVGPAASSRLAAAPGSAPTAAAAPAEGAAAAADDAAAGLDPKAGAAAPSAEGAGGAAEAASSDPAKPSAEAGAPAEEEIVDQARSASRLEQALLQAQDAADVEALTRLYLPPEPEKEGEPLELSIDTAALMALENNPSLAVERLRPQIARTQEAVQWGLYDPLVTAEIGRQRDVGERLSAAGALNPFDTTAVVGEAGIEQRFPTGTSVRAEVGTEVDDVSRARQWIRSYTGLTVTQSLLRGASVKANLARVREARIDWLASKYQLRGFAEAVLAQVETAYWDCVLAELEVHIFEQSVDLAQRRFEVTRKRIEAGTLSETELVAAEASLARRRERLLNAKSQLEKARLVLLRLLDPPAQDKWRRPMDLPDPPVVPNTRLDKVEDHVEVALRMRPDLNQARLQVQRGDLEVVRTRDGLLPMLDLFASIAKTGYAERAADSWKNLDGDDYELYMGVRTQFPLRNRTARALHRQAVLTRDQAVEALRNLEQLVQLDVRTAYEEVRRATEQIRATHATRRLRAEALRAEIERWNIGRSTELDVERALRDLEDSRTAVAEAIVDYLKALVTLFQMDGSLLVRRGVEAPGGEAVTLEGFEP
jgi:outer membrane protein TolC